MNFCLLNVCGEVTNLPKGENYEKGKSKTQRKGRKSHCQ